jgi:hypothetical protein
MLLFLDFDGVLHPDEVYLTRKGPELRASGTLFMWAEILAEELVQWPQVEIVLSSSWVRTLGFHRAKNYLPESLKTRVIGSTWHSSMAKEWADKIWWDQSTRHGQIRRHVGRANLINWLAIDDNAEGWAASDLHRLVHTNGQLGLSDIRALSELRTKLSSN